MKTYLLPEKGEFYKANLHAHSTGSDGKMPPEEMKQEFKKRGYSVLSITEHEVLKNYTYLSDNDFIFINGCELSINEQNGEHWAEHKCAHINFYSKHKDEQRTFCFSPENVWFLNEEEIKNVPHIGEFYNRKYTVECVNDIIKIGKENDFIACLNHPTWSLQMPNEYLNYKGLYALEIFNTDCVDNGYNDYDTAAYDLMCKSGIHIACQMADDNHNGSTDRFLGTFGGFNMIKTQDFSYEGIIKALEKGDFYCSQSPEIYSLYVEDDYVYIECSPVKVISMDTGIRCTRKIVSNNNDYLTSAKFRLDKKYKYVRFEIVDKNNKRANTRAYFVEEW